MNIFRSAENPKLIFVRMTRSEALRTIESLAHQLDTRDPNDWRYESFADDGTQFSISVFEPPPIPKEPQ